MASNFCIGVLALVCMFSMLVSAQYERAFFFRNRSYIILNCIAAICAVIAISAFTGVFL